jgi:hypothetical protein
VDGAYYTNEFPGNIAELDTVEFELEIGPFESGYHTILVSLNTEGDINISNNQDSVVLGVRYEFRTFVLNEFIPQPISGLPEFVEIVNMSSDTVDLKNWRITDSNEGLNYGLGSVSIAMDEYVVIAADSTLVDSVPNGVPYLTPDGGFPTLNNSGDEIRIFDPFNTLIDSLFYSSTWGIDQGISLEKYYPNDSSHIQGNWAPSTSLSGFTIGAPNAVTPAIINGTLLSENIYYSPSIPSETDEVIMSIPILNSGTSIFSGMVQVFFNNVMINQAAINSGNIGDTVLVDISIGTFNSGFNEMSLSLIVENDENENDNTGLDTLKIRYPFGTILINEFMSAPNNDQSEFVELFAFRNLNMVEWSISDNHLDPVLLNTISVSSGDFIVVLSDSNMMDILDGNAHLFFPFNFPSLNNSGDGIYLFDHTESVIDSLNYDTDWPLTSERSTEKIRQSYTSNGSSNWLLADENISMTPGANNSVMVLDVDGMIILDSITYSPIPPYPDSVVTILIPIVNAGVESFDGTFSIEMYDDEIGDGTIPIISMGDTIIIESKIVSSISGLHSISIILDIVDDGNYENNIATFLLPVRYLFGSVLVNEFFPLPDSTESEFVEIIPQTNVNINNWTIRDLGGAKGVLPNLDISAFTYCLITDDSSFLDIIPDTSILILPGNGLPGLNNSSETIYILDHTESVIDSLQYNENWALMDSRSVEKYRITDTSNEPNNWGISVGEAGKTPGFQNSLFFSDLPSKGRVTISPDPFSPDGDGIDDELTITYSLPYLGAAIRWEIIDMAGRVIAKPYYNYQVGQNGKLKWNGKRDNGKSARIGIYVMKISFQDVASTQSWETVKTVVLAKPL